VSLAILALEEGEEDQAESMARESLAEFKAENDADQSVIAENVLAKSLIARKAFVQASSEINAAEKLGAHDVLSRLSLSITKAQVLFNTGKNEEAQKKLQEAERSASEGTIVTLEWEARLALADAQRLSGNFSAARANLVLVKKQAASNGFGLYANRATALETRLR
jgi:predicted Zn-dependent protease